MENEHRLMNWKQEQLWLLNKFYRDTVEAHRQEDGEVNIATRELIAVLILESQGYFETSTHFEFMKCFGHFSYVKDEESFPAQTLKSEYVIRVTIEDIEQNQTTPIRFASSKAVGRIRERVKHLMSPDLCYVWEGVLKVAGTNDKYKNYLGLDGFWVNIDGAVSWLGETEEDAMEMIDIMSPTL